MLRLDRPNEIFCSIITIQAISALTLPRPEDITAIEAFMMSQAAAHNTTSRSTYRTITAIADMGTSFFRTYWQIVVLESNGCVLQQGTPAQFARRPATQYVARLVGLNPYAGMLDPATQRVSFGDGGAFLVTFGDEQMVADPAVVAAAVVGDVALRPRGEVWLLIDVGNRRLAAGERGQHVHA